jgi:hypothetical protein
MITLATYEDWKHCIFKQCRLPLTRDFITQRLAVLADRQDWTTQRFVDVWGEGHLRQVIAWFERALAEIEGGSHA